MLLVTVFLVFVLVFFFSSILALVYVVFSKKVKISVVLFININSKYFGCISIFLLSSLISNSIPRFIPSVLTSVI